MNYVRRELFINYVLNTFNIVNNFLTMNNSYQYHDEKII